MQIDQSRICAPCKLWPPSCRELFELSMQAIELLVERLAAEAVSQELCDIANAGAEECCEQAGQEKLGGMPFANLEINREPFNSSNTSECLLRSSGLHNAGQSRNVREPCLEGPSPESIGCNGSPIVPEKGCMAIPSVGQAATSTTIYTESVSACAESSASEPVTKESVNGSVPGERQAAVPVSPRATSISTKSTVNKKPARNRPCPCNSGRRYKDCCGPKAAAVARRRAAGQMAAEAERPNVQADMPLVYV